MLYTPPEQPDDRAKLIRDNLELVNILVGRMTTQVPSFMSRDDMRSAGMVGLIDAANKFDTSKNILFKTFAEYRIRGAILDEMRKLDWFSRSLRDKQSRIAKTLSHLEISLAREPEDHEVAEAMGIATEEYQKMLSEVSHLGCVSLNETLDNSEQGKSFLETLEDQNESASPSSRLENHELTKIMAELIARLSEKEQLVITLYYYEELTQKEIAEVLEISEGRVSQLHSQALIKLKNKVQSRL